MTINASVCIVVPTRHEGHNIAELVCRVERALEPCRVDWEMVFVDDSDDETPEVILQIARERGDDRIRLIHRRPGERDDSIAGAVAQGIRSTGADVIAVIDADLQHPPEILPHMLAPLVVGRADVCVPSRYLPGGSAAGLERLWRRLASRACGLVIKGVFAETRVVNDPAGGLFAIRREILDGADLRPTGFKVLAEVLVRGNWSNHCEFPYQFEPRQGGTSKARLRDGVAFLRHVSRLRMSTLFDASRRSSTRRRVAPVHPLVIAKANQLGWRDGDLVPHTRISGGRGSTSSMRILVIASERPPVVSGVSRAVHQLVDGLQARGHEVVTLAAADAPYFARGEFRVSGLVARLRSVLPDIDQFDVVNIHGPAPTISDVALGAIRSVPRSRRPPVVYTHHFTIDFNRRWLMAGCRAYDALVRRLAGGADRIVVTSRSYADLLAAPAQGRAVIIPWGIDRDRFWSPSDAAYDGSRDLRVLYVGQLRAYKGALVAVDALAGLPGITLTIVGRGPLEQEIRRRISGLSANGIHFRGYVDDEALADAYARHDVVVLPSISRLEAFGIALLEGMASGCVPIASDLPGVRDVAADCGMLAAPDDIVDLRWALQTLAARPELVAELRQEAMVKAERYTWCATIDGYEGLFQDLVSEVGSPRAFAVA